MNILLRWPPTFALEITASACNFKASGASIIQVSFLEQYFSITGQFTQVVRKKKNCGCVEWEGGRVGGDFSASSTPDVKALIWPCEARNTLTSRTERGANGWREQRRQGGGAAGSESGISFSNLPNGTKSFSFCPPAPPPPPI